MHVIYWLILLWDDHGGFYWSVTMMWYSFIRVVHAVLQLRSQACRNPILIWRHAWCAGCCAVLIIWCEPTSHLIYMATGCSSECAATHLYAVILIMIFVMIKKKVPPLWRTKRSYMLSYMLKMSHNSHLMRVIMAQIAHMYVLLETHRNHSSYLTWSATDVVISHACLDVWLPQLDVM